MIQPEPGRNDPCPCGSGKKYKKCCMRFFEESPVVRSDANSVENYVKQGFSQQKQSAYKEAAESYRKALRINPDHTEALNNLGNVYQFLNCHEDAVVCYRRALKNHPENAVIHFNLGNVLQTLGRSGEAKVSYLQAIRVDQKFADAYNNLGMLFQSEQNFEEAVANYKKALSIKPDFVCAQKNLDQLLSDLRLSEKQKLAEEYFQRGLIKQEQELNHEALSNYRKVIEIDPEYAEAYINLGNVQRDLYLHSEAEESYKSALEINHHLFKAYNNLGVVQHELGRPDEAEKNYLKAIEIKPEFADSHNNLGNNLKESGLYEEAIQSYRRAVELNPTHTGFHSNLLFAHNYFADQSPEAMLQEARRYGKKVAQNHPYSEWCNSKDPERCLRIGMVSGDFRDHPVSYFIEGILKSMSSSGTGKVELFAYYNHSHSDQTTERLKPLFKKWSPVFRVSDEALARQIREDGIDILIDLSGHTAHNRLPLFAWKPAPVQASWLGYFATTGVEAIDYLIADPWTLPESEEQSFTEMIYRLPETRLCFTPPIEDPGINPLPALSSNEVTFSCFNKLDKLNEGVVATWSQILKAIPTSKLLLKMAALKEPSTRQRLIERFAAQGIPPEQLILEGISPRAEYLATYQRVDIALDPFPYTGGTTTAEALWMGVPVLTMEGKSFLSRQGVGLLMNAGLPEWIAKDTEDYVSKAVSLSRDRACLAMLRANLRQQVLASPVFDAERFAIHFEEALRGMWRRWVMQM